MEKAWKLKGDLSLISLVDDFFLLKFTAVEDYDMVLAGGPWFLLGKPFILQRWDPKFQPKRDESAAIPLWIKIVNLPLALWTPSGISKIASYIGIPLYVDALTAKRTRLTFARVCVEVDKNSVLADEIPIEIDGLDINLKVVYDWKPTRCEGCGSLIHSFALCPKNPTPKVLIPQKPPTRGRSKSRGPAARAVSNSREKVSLVPPVHEKPHQKPNLEPSSSKVPPDLPSGKSIVLPNLNLPQADSFLANHSLPNTLLKPTQVLLANSFQALPLDAAVNPEDDPNDEEVIEEETSSSSKTVMETILKPSTHKASSSSSKATSSPKKAKAKSAKKAKSHK
ncbi:uncharacterized protein LOC110096349 [Dendrobium catenatum]|uniref:uncharacterized protein LOC110096349 n=1 Tax=Dendrobium catenatum TaxID=906689 RepID=UPI0009F2BA99|nr:uncharacterized protein LOC110096349 [Dendrobium catenatum]